MFALAVEYLLGRSFAARFDNASLPEWPANPSRLFSALAAAFFEDGGSATERAALQWLEQCGPPSIRCGTAGRPEPVLAFVPTNYPGEGVHHGRQPREFPAQGPSDPVVHYIWPDAEPGATVREALAQIASRIAALGRACSLVQIRVTEEAPAPTLTPDDGGDLELQVPFPGRLVDLENSYRLDRRPSEGAIAKYRAAGSVRPEAVTTEFEAISFLEKTAGPGLPVEAALTVTEALRRALISRAQELGEVPAALHGHERGTHCALLAVPFVGGRHADGHLMGVGLVFPRGLDPGDRKKILVAYRAVAENGLHIPGVGDWGLTPVDALTAPRSLRAPTWAREARVWRTVTPIVLDRFPKKSGLAVEEIVAAACGRIGISAEVEVEYGPWGYVTGVPAVKSFRLRRSGDERACWAVHARLRFAEPVKGPILLGAGRYFGIGLLRPAGEGDGQ